MSSLKTVVLVMCLAFFYILSGCAEVEVKDFKPREHGDTPPGPGLFSGEDGYFDILPGKKK